MTETNIEIGIVDKEGGFRRLEVGGVAEFCSPAQPVVPLVPRVAPFCSHPVARSTHTTAPSPDRCSRPKSRTTSHRLRKYAVC
jgi:hypothetical protein